MASSGIGDYEGMLRELHAPVARIFPVLEGKVAIVTGAAQGMGKATSLLFAKSGASVVLADINEAGAQKVAEEIEQVGGRAHVVATDISVSSDVQRLVEETVATFGKLDCAVNNAALTPDGAPFSEFDEAYFNRLISINVTGTALCNKYEIAQLLKQGTGGSIVNISSVVAYHAHANMVAYTTAKHAIVGITKQAAAENGHANIRVNTVAPGAILTEMSAKALVTMGMDHEAYARQVSMLGRWAAPTEVAQASLWLCSDASSYVTATLLPVDAGSHTK